MAGEAVARLKPSALGAKFVPYDPVNPVGRFAVFLKEGDAVRLLEFVVKKPDPLIAVPPG